MLNLEGFFIFLICALLAYGSFQLSRLAYGDNFAPLGIFLGINLISLSLYHLKLIQLNNLSFQAYSLIAVSLFSFFFGAILVSPSIILKGKCLPKRNLFCEKNSSKRGLISFYYFTAILATLGWILLLTNFLLGYSLKQIYALQSHFHSLPYIGYLNLLSILVAPSFLLISLARRGVTSVSFCFLLSAIFGLFLAGIKTYIVFSLVASFLAWSASRPGKIRLKHLFIIAIGVLVFMVIYNQFIDIYVSREVKRSIFPKAFSFFESPYIYTVGSWPAMSAVIQNPPEQPRRGFLTLHFLWKILGSGLKTIPPVPEVQPGVDIGIPSTFNVYSLIGGLYWDYGLLGSVLGCFFLGFISTLFYILARKRSSWVLHLLSSVFTFGLFISFFSYYYRFNLLLLMLYVFVFGFSFQKISPLLSRAIRILLSSTPDKKLANDS